MSHRESLDKQIVQALALLVTLLEFVRLSSKLLVRQALHLWLQSIYFIHQRLHLSPDFATVFVEHTGQIPKQPCLRPELRPSSLAALTQVRSDGCA